MVSKMNKLKSLLLAGATTLSLVACNKSSNSTSSTTSNTTLGNWVKVADIDGSGRYYASSFVIGNYAYVVGGAGYGNTPSATALKDMWRFDPSANGGQGSWFGTQLAPIPVGRNSGVGFAINNKGYVGTGSTVFNINQGGTQLNDMWEYDPTANTWKQMASVPGGPRFAAIGFNIGNLGYVGTGQVADPNNPGNYISIKDFYSFDPTKSDTGKWVAESSMVNDKRYGAQSFANNSMGYVVGGINDGGTASTDFEVFTPGAAQGAGTWKVLTPIKPLSDSSKTSAYTSDLARCNGVVLVIGGYAYLVTGSTSYQGASVNTNWMYNFQTDQWVQRSPYPTANTTPRPARFGAVGFVVNGRAFVGSGTASVSQKPFSTFDEFQPNVQLNTNN